MIFLLILSTFSNLIISSSAQNHYVPVQIVIPTLNDSTVKIIHNTTLNETETKNHTGWNNPLLNKTGEENWNYTTTNGHLIIGKISSSDHRLFKQVYTYIWESKRWWLGHAKFIAYPNDLPGNYGRHETISAVRAFNQLHEGLHSNAELLAGGVGKRYVKIKLSSKWGKGFKYMVVIYGH